ncbi:site-specific integrase [Halorubrum sp. SD690R]|uniref:tyrosine-type recombinase/integrase n=1 Tax=Halorubrum sp. SD690R TaxID=2518117 RepID=UPI0010F490F9|nr:tyrosine-type recombinase/integrase [Halorubrum sp. SD690R]TKX47821.1 site-specific integrase [Halorubrum sp. SD690R]
MSELDPIEPQEAVDLYLRHRADELADSSQDAHRLRLKHFVRWCDNEGIANLNTLTGRRLHEYRLWRREDGDLNRVSVRTQMSTLRAFVQLCEQFDFVETGLSDAVDVPTIEKGENARSVHIEYEQAQRIQERLEKYEYATLRHVIFLILWRTGIRTGTARGLDVDDVDLDDRHLRVRHRPKSETPLKNKSRAERLISISQGTADVLNDWITDRHSHTEDDYGRTPLLGTDYGRISRSGIRRQTYWVTSPQFVGEECSCDVSEHQYNRIYECDDAVSPHAVRRGSITWRLRSDAPKPAVSDRSNVSSEVLDEHYNEMTQTEKMEKRRSYFDDA